MLKMNLFITLLPIILMFGLMYLLLILPEKKRNKKYNEMLSQLEKNDEVMTRGGIIGKIIIIEENNVIIETSAERTKIKVSKTGIATKLNKED
ncbi:MAG: preprotein translocase subunit YajC [Clostridium septicum]|uniref:Preprotein translocase subunit YajC n=2 Tax=Clostridium septicum TaxID=1504 RepID=A0A9N7PK41_CLOSE|nr:preprotein translocase subunit YajC [Clostridium septicum]AYE35486.1 preprotein translocase subunit YajC [Clostridium septicum]MDU1314670.1 preprotein translocase subunit YajC [Clostridium septicum]QAS60872.1 preprotein translocase subunit YajC [Clostridium septicum]UEC19858.1 preprotein translocase subunit YajC [Clostridium septicum]USS02082.1 preprotein translocase subunit YajC [Clostridium septicum]